MSKQAGLASFHRQEEITGASTADFFFMNSIFLFMNNLVGTQTLEADTRWKEKKIGRLYINPDTNLFYDTIVFLGFIK